ncbi:alpha/beta hydrolase [Amycolatopsis rhabdoformis]|uniref:Alpha/beta hydrolase n=1 Tax=Amycolatopsis rhabdoformis TaxID=1448059 RepID=A0ABZ1IAM3_9PSEU|nr:alpha/beta hydrolase [Amycolatopsis rhabdoformis]WSE30977.1 alpha/beta hydrolase [Amycolatopsis rhabdoformis]
MTSAILNRPLVLLPGTGSDEVFVQTVFAGPSALVGARLITPAPPPGAALADGYLEELDRLARVHGSLIVGGVSFGAHLAAEWAVANPGRCEGLVCALPAWNGEPGSAAAAVAARASADLVAAQGVDGALAAVAAGSPGWLVDELSRAWRRQGDELVAGLRVAAERRAPSVAELATVDVPAGVAGCDGDLVHPVAVAREWAATVPRGAVEVVRLADFGRDREVLGRAGMLAFLKAASA